MQIQTGGDSLAIDSLLSLLLIRGSVFCIWVLFYLVLSVLSSFEIIAMRKREQVVVI